MRDFLVKRWFLLLLLGGIGWAWFCPDWLPGGIAGLPPLAVVGPALFLMAVGLETRSLVRTLGRPLPALWAVAISYGPVPALGWLAGRLLPQADLRVGLMISTSVPCTLASAVLWTRRAGGNEATALLVVLLTTGSSWLATTAWLVGATGMEGVAVDPADMMRLLVYSLVMPVGLGQLARTVGPLARAATRHKGALGAASQLLILIVIIKAAAGVRREFDRTEPPLGLGPILASAGVCLGIHLAAWAVGFWGGKAFGFGRPDRIAVGFACSQKTLPVGLVLFETYFRTAHPLAVVPLAFYHFGQLIVDTFIADRLASRQPAGARV